MSYDPPTSGVTPPPAEHDHAAAVVEPSTEGAPRAAVDSPKRQSVRATMANLPVPIVLVLLSAIFSILAPTTFFTVSNLQVILGTQAIAVLLALAITVGLVANEFDLSVASVLALSGVALGYLTVEHHWPIGLAILVVLAMGTAIGAINGFLVVRVGMGSFITTLGTGTLVLGLAAKLTNDTILTGLPPFLSTITTSTVAGIQVAFFFGLGAAIVLWYVLEHTPVGRWTIFVGTGPDVARLSGLPVNAIRLGVLMVSAAMAAGAGILQAGLSASADPNAGGADLLPAFAAAFLGATSFKRGRFNVWGTFLAVYMVDVGIVGLQITTGATGWIVYVFNGGVLVAAVAASRLLTAHDERSR